MFLNELNSYKLGVLYRNEESESSDFSNNSFHDPSVNIPEDIHLLHGLPVSKSGILFL